MPEHEEQIIHSTIAMMAGVIDRRMHALERLREQANRALIDSAVKQTALPSPQTKPDKEEE